MIISQLKKGDQYDGLVRIDTVSRPGPFIYAVSDGTGSIDAVTHSYEAEKDIVVRLKGTVEDRNGKLQIRVSSLKQEEVPFDEIVRSNRESQQRPLSIQSQTLASGRDTISEIARKLMDEAAKGSAFLIRAHGDADGITGWISLHRALSSHNASSKIFTNISKLPFYQYDDAMRDLSLLSRFSDACLVLVDNGSTKDDSAACRLVASAGITVIVIDHHAPVDEASEGRALHLSPHLFGGDENLPAGALAYEVARQVDPSMDDPALPGISCVGDKCSGDIAEAYISNTGKDREALFRYARAIDFLAYHLRFDSPLHLYERLLKDPTFSSEVMEHAEALMDKAVKRQQLRKDTVGETLVCQFDVEAEGFPPAGKIVGAVFESLREEAEDIVLVGIIDDLLIVRSTGPILFEWHAAMQDIEEVSGGGHPHAGTLRVKSTSKAFETLHDILRKKSENS